MKLEATFFKADNLSGLRSFDNMLDEISITITISIPLDDFILLDVDLDWGLDIARIKRRITIILITFKSGLILDINDLFSFNKDKDDCLNVACVNLPNLYQNNIATGIIIAISRYSGSAKYKSLNITILLLCQNSQGFLTQYH